jgi:phosphoglycolate phosphatase-like HAD superfamily hydrolase
MSVKKKNIIFKDKICYVFDFDGVIKDSVSVKTKAFVKIYENEGKIVSKKVKEYHLKNGGMPRTKKFQFYEETLLKKKPDIDKINDLCNRFSAIVKNEVVNSKSIPGVITYLDNLNLINTLKVINSATPLKELNEIIFKCNYNKYFHKIYGSPSSKIENLLSIKKDFNLSSKQIVFFGDAESDLLAARKLNIAFVGVGKFFKNMNIKESDKYLFIDHFNELI